MKMFLTEDEVLVKVKSLVKKYRCEIFNFVALCSGMGIVWSTTTGTRINDVTAVTLSVKCLNPLKLYPLSGSIFRKWFASYFLFIHEHFIIVLSPTVNLIAVTTLYWHPVYISASKEYLRRIQQITFMLLEAAFHYLFYLKFSFKLVTFSESYARRYKWVFFFRTQCRILFAVLNRSLFYRCRLSETHWSEDSVVHGNT